MSRSISPAPCFPTQFGCDAAAADACTFGLGQRHPAADELLDAHHHAEKARQQMRQPIGIAHLPRQQAGEREPGVVGAARTTTCANLSSASA